MLFNISKLADRQQLEFGGHHFFMLHRSSDDISIVLGVMEKKAEPSELWLWISMYIHYCPGLIEVYSLKQNMWLGLGHPRNEGRVQSSCLHLVYKATVLYILCSE